MRPRIQILTCPRWRRLNKYTRRRLKAGVTPKDNYKRSVKRGNKGRNDNRSNMDVIAVIRKASIMQNDPKDKTVLRLSLYRNIGKDKRRY
jgi:hypothetical protein